MYRLTQKYKLREKKERQWSILVIWDKKDDTGNSKTSYLEPEMVQNVA